MSARYLIRLDDIAPNMHWEHFERLVESFGTYRIRPLLGVIPDNCDPQLLPFPAYDGDFWKQMRKYQSLGWEISQHGYQHLYVSRERGLMGINGLSEFAGLPFDEQLDKLRRGQEILREHGLRFETFMAPSHSFDELTLRALSELGFTTITDGFAPQPYRNAGLTFIPQLFELPRPLPFGTHTFCLHLNVMNEPQIQQVERFIAEHYKQFITFPEARELATSAIWNRIAGQLTAATLRPIRTWKRRHRLAA